MERALRVLLLDQDPDHRAAVARRLGADLPAARVEPCADLRGLPLAPDPAPDLVVLGCGDGPALLLLLPQVSELKARHPGLPVVALVPEEAEGSALAAMRAGLDDYALGEPTALAATVRAALARAEHRRRTEEAAQRTARALRESEERYALAMSGTNAGLWDWDLEAESVYFSPRFKSILGCAQDEIGSNPAEWLERVHPEDVRTLDAALGAHLAGLTPQLECEHRVLHKDGRYRFMLCRGLALRDPDGRAVRMAGSLTDITERKLSEQQLVHDAFHDALTGLPNRALYMDRLERSLARATRNLEHRVAVLFLDLDRFKLINDSLGHLMGDRLLVETARRLERCLRPEDTVARLGGDEFAILLEEIAAVSDAVRIAERIEQQLRRPVALEGHEVFTSLSIGIALSAPGGGKAEDLVRDADTAMFRSKALGTGKPVVFDPAMHVNVLSRLHIETDLRLAIEREELSIHFQPIVHLASGRLAELEALARWREADGGSPAEFIPVAEETGLILPLGHWVLSQSCRRMADWHRRFPERADLSISVNLSNKQFSQPDLIARVDAILLETGLPGDRLTLEITESVLMENAAKAVAMLHELQARNIRLCIDDFGTGYSSLSYLHSFPLHRLKLDRTFVSRIAGHDHNPRNLEIVRAVIDLAHNLGMEVIAEGVEDGEQLARLAELGCDYGQGFLFCRPAAAEDLEELLARGGSFLVSRR